MKKFVLAVTGAFLMISSQAHASVDLSQLAGAWKMNCTQSQSNGPSGYMVETYTFTASETYQLSRLWFQDSACTQSTSTETESGSIAIGNEDINHGFNPSNTYDTQYKTSNGTELGLLWVDSAYSEIRISRGFGSSQNTMLGLFLYFKQ